MNARANSLPVENIPQELRERPQWVAWRYVTRNGKQTKIPVDARAGNEASSTDPATWCSFEEAMAAWQRNLALNGVGFVFSPDDPYCGIDLDDSIDPQTGQFKPWAFAIAAALNSYSEISPSGQGVKIIIRGKKPGPRCRMYLLDGGLEIYDSGRFFTITGNIVEQFNRVAEERQEPLNELYRATFEKDNPPTSPTPSPSVSAPSLELEDQQIIDKARSARNGSKFKALWSGNWESSYGSQSEADSALMFMLAFYTKDARQLDRLFRSSGLMRDKWDEKHGAKTYGQMTIDNALAKVSGQWQPKQRGRSITRAADDAPDMPGEDGLPALGQRDPQTGRIVLSPRKTLPSAHAFVEQFYMHEMGRAIHNYAGAFMTWRGNRFAEVEEDSLRQQLLPWLHAALRPQFNKLTGQMELVGFDSNPTSVKAALESTRALVHLPVTITPPAWLCKSADLPDPANLLPFASGTLNLLSGEVLKPTPLLFNINAIDFDYDPHAPPPLRWLRFLAELWGSDTQSIELLQEWCGYNLVADTRQQKMLLIVGPKRSGKGTVARVMTRLVGCDNVVGPTTSSLAGAFGLQPLIGKSLAIVSDARFSGDSTAVVVERLLCISGEDTLTVDRKFLGSVTMKLPTRFMFLSNELPRMNDASAALAGRFVILRLTNTFFGREDTSLTQQLMTELPGILLWAIEGLKRLRQRGHFVQPQAVADAVREMEDLASPVLAFVRDCCIVAPGSRVWVDEIYTAWKQWCEREGRSVVTNKQTFGRDLAAAVAGITRRRGVGDVPFYQGIQLKGEVP